MAERRGNKKGGDKKGRGRGKGKGKGGSNSNNNDRDEGKLKFKKKRKKVCVFCAEKETLDYKNMDLMRRLITDRGKIAPRRMTGCCAKHQRAAAKIVKRARHATLLPYVME
ncbi:MAG: 30S ribosomal protein S18 [Candidatus Saganbacteria bacterium]|nr:30S ribosomal protein S18 [Candidatus Saganbacteria bacterium]